jgi:hypothetical protein
VIQNGRFMSCPPQGTFDLSRVAAQYSTLAGVLAGFAFFALIFLLEQRDRAEDRAEADAHIAIALLCSLLSLIVAALLYAILAGEQQAALVGRAASEEMLSGIAFSLGVISLLYAIALLVAHAGVEAADRPVRVILSIIGPPLALLFVIFGAEDVAYSEILRQGHLGPKGELVECGSQAMLDALSTWGSLVLPLLLLTACLGLWVVPWLIQRLAGRSKWTRLPKLIKGHPNTLPYISLAATIVMAVVSATFSEQNPALHLLPGMVWALLVVFWILLFVQAAFLRWVSWSDSTPIVK